MTLSLHQFLIVMKMMLKKKNKCEENNVKLFYYTEYKNYQMFDIYNKENTFTNLETFKKKILDKRWIF